MRRQVIPDSPPRAPADDAPAPPDRVRRRIPFAAACAFLLGVLYPPAAVRADVVTLADGTRIANCKVLTEDAASVGIDLDNDGSPDRTVPSEQVAEVRHSDRPLEYRQAELFLKSGKYNLAVKAFEGVAKSAPVSSWLAVYADYYRALALERWARSEPGKARAAVEALADFVRRHGNSRFVHQARLSLANAYLLAGKLGEVRRLAQAVVKEKPDTPWALQGRLLLARVKLKEGRPEEALREFDAVISALTDRRSPLRAEALLGKGLTLFALGKADEAERLLSRLIEATEDSTIRARAYNALGDAYFKKGDYAEARLKYLRVVLLYFQADPAEHAKALHGAAECFRRLGEQERADELFRELLRRYPGTPWAARARSPGRSRRR